MPNFFSIRMIGLYLIFISILLWSHLNYVLELDINGMEIFKATIDNFMISLKVVSNIDGGGIIGAFFSWSFVKLLSIQGAQIVSIALIIFGIVMLFNISIVDSIKWLVDKIKGWFKKDKKDKVKEAEDNYEKDNKVVVSSVDDLIHVTDASNEDKKNESVVAES